MYEHGQTRRQLLKGALGTAGVIIGAPVLRLAAQISGSVGPVRLSDDLYVITMSGEANVVAHTANGAVDVIDCARGIFTHSIGGLPGVAGVLVDGARDLAFTSNRAEVIHSGPPAI